VYAYADFGPLMIYPRSIYLSLHPML